MHSPHPLSAASHPARFGLSLALLAALAVTALPDAQAQTHVSGVRVTSLASLRPSGEDVTSPDGTLGWPGARHPTSPPLFAVKPGTTTGYLYGGFLGAGWTGNRPTLYTAVGLYSMRAGVSVYERLAFDFDTDLQGRINSTPVRSSSGALYAVMTSLYGEQYAGTDEKSNYTYSATVGQGLIVRTDFDGAYPSVVESSRGKLYSPNGALVIDAKDNLYGVDKGPQGQGRIFRINLGTGVLSTVHEFAVGPKGMKQVANDIVLGGDGFLYGVTAYRRGLPLAPGTPNAPDTPTGTLYRIDPNAAGAGSTVLHTFTLAEGELNVGDNVTHEGFRLYPSEQRVTIGMTGPATLRSLSSGEQNGLSSLVDGGDGYLYGTTSVADCYTYVHNLNTLTGLPSVTRNSPLCGFRSWAAAPSAFSYPGAYPYHDGPRPYGAVWRIARNGSGSLQVLHTFNEDDGATPRGPLALAPDGAIYGTTLAGGTHTCSNRNTANAEVRCGTLYRIRPSAIAVEGGGHVANGGFEKVHSFSGNDGRIPLGVRAGADGRLYGVTSMGGSYADSQGKAVPTDFGTVFQVAVNSDGAPDASVSLVASPTQLKAGETSTLTWISSNATQCTAASSANDWRGSVADFGAVSVTPKPGTYRYTLTCNVAGSAFGAQVSASTTVYVGTDATAVDGNTVSFGNGGGGAASPVWLLALAVLGRAASLRRKRKTPHTSTSITTARKN